MNYCNKNKLVINEDKTLLCRITSCQQHQANPLEQVILDQLDEDGNNIRPKEVVRILGTNIVYIIQLWGTCPVTWINKMQICLNSTARYVLNCGKSKKVSYLMDECKFLSVNQMICYYSVLMLWKQWRWNKNGHLLMNIYNKKTRYGRQLPDNKLQTHRGQKLITEQSWRQSSVKWWNELPSNLRNEVRMKQFKNRLRIWVKDNIPLKLY